MKNAFVCSPLVCHLLFHKDQGRHVRLPASSLKRDKYYIYLTSSSLSNFIESFNTRFDATSTSILVMQSRHRPLHRMFLESDPGVHLTRVSCRFVSNLLTFWGRTEKFRGYQTLASHCFSQIRLNSPVNPIYVSPTESRMEKGSNTEFSLTALPNMRDWVQILGGAFFVQLPVIVVHNWLVRASIYCSRLAIFAISNLVTY